MADGDTFQEIGTELHAVVGKPATFDAAGFAALSWVEVLGVISIPERGDTVADVNEATLKDGRVEHFAGQKDGGSLSVPIKHIEGDAGQALLKGAAGLNTTVSFKEVDIDGTVTYYYGRVAEMRRRESTTSSFKGWMASVRVNSARLEVAA